MRFLFVFVLLFLMAPAAAQESLPGEATTAADALFENEPFFVAEVPAQTSAPATVDRTCCGREHLETGDHSYTAPEQYGFDTRKEKELVEFRLLITDGVQAPAPKPRQVVDEWDK